MPPEEGSPGEGPEENGDWSDTLAYEANPEAAVQEDEVGSEHWDRWHYGVYLAAGLLLVGAVRLSLPLIIAGYVLTPLSMYLDSRYLDSVTPGWQPDTGLHVVGGLLFPFLMIPAYLYRRREL